eukprot:100302-Chlamydomonas_euryale.AAC.1
MGGAGTPVGTVDSMNARGCPIRSSELSSPPAPPHSPRLQKGGRRRRHARSGGAARRVAAAAVGGARWPVGGCQPPFASAGARRRDGSARAGQPPFASAGCWCGAAVGLARRAAWRRRRRQWARGAAR